MQPSTGSPPSAGCLLDRVEPEKVDTWFDAAGRDRPGAANRSFETLCAMMFRATEEALRERRSNPCPGIARNPAKKVARFIAADTLTAGDASEA